MYQRAIELLGNKIGRLEAENAVLTANLDMQGQKVRDLQQQVEMLTPKPEEESEVIQDGKISEL